jgi:hypothetical protein
MKVKETADAITHQLALEIVVRLGKLQGHDRVNELLLGAKLVGDTLRSGMKPQELLVADGHQAGPKDGVVLILEPLEPSNELVDEVLLRVEVALDDLQW